MVEADIDVPVFYDRRKHVRRVHELAKEARRRAPEAILKDVARKYHVAAEELTGTSRRPTVCKARDHAVFRFRQALKWSWNEIGEYFGGRDHSTVMSAAGRHAARTQERG